MDLADNTLRIGDIIALSGSIVGVIVSYIRVQAKASATEEKLEEHKELMDKWTSDFKSRMHDMANQLTGTNLRSALNSEKIEAQEKELEALINRQTHFDFKILDKLEKLQKDLSRIEGKMGMAESR